MTITLKTKEVKDIIFDKPSLLISANTILEKAKEIIVEEINPIKVEVLLEENDYVNETVTIYITCEIGKEGWIDLEMIVLPKHIEI
ncbi:hypothetical protein OCK74_12295 [Chitinophagaceae bacterium LB-8]|uniref:Uncharacterized protein n=1 Tax=Paraflavisolibacter caeni TaxID=2982496 RepID=A0A9X2XYD2_9BACT|nr:hypothetical protein [Paraflavisolibacter caeni]MCU7549903.1 hypothetical protein [Paraflavisolibacter caeni]